MRGGALRLGPVAPRIMLATATEDALSLARMHLGASVWAAFGDANLAHVSLPREVKEVVLCGDSDPQGRAAVADAAATFADRRIAVETLFPHAGAKDFNEEWVLLHA
jgi:DNA primase